MSKMILVVYCLAYRKYLMETLNSKEAVKLVELYKLLQQDVFTCHDVDYEKICKLFNFAIKAYAKKETPDDDLKLCWLVLKAGKLSLQVQQNMAFQNKQFAIGKKRECLVK